MAENSAIEWCDHTFNPWIGCTKVGPGCDHCYAETLSKARLGVPWGLGAPRRPTAASTWAQPRRWERAAAAFLAKHGRRQRVFCASLADVFDNEAPAEWRADLFALIRETPSLDWLLVTKRIGNAAKMAEAAAGWLENVWLGATIVNQAEAERDIPKLLTTFGPRKRFLSIEPLLDSVHIRDHWLIHHHPGDAAIDWVIVGGESGLDARPMHPDWARSLRDQCAAAGVPFLFKQWGEWLPGQNDPFDERDARRGMGVAQWQDGGWGLRDARRPVNRNYVMWESDGTPHPGGSRSADNYFQVHRWASRVGKKAAGRLLDGVQHDGVPA